MNGLESAGAVKDRVLLVTTIKEEKKLFANAYLALELVLFTLYFAVFLLEICILIAAFILALC